MELLLQPKDGDNLGQRLKDALADSSGLYHSFYAAVAFVKRAGVKHIANELAQFADAGNKTCIVAGIDHGGTSQEGLSVLIGCIGQNGKLFVHHSLDANVTFHPKLYFFEGEERSILLVGSGNLTEGGLYTNDEASAVLLLNPNEEKDSDLISEIKSCFADWCDESAGNAIRLNATSLPDFFERENIPLEAFSVKLRWPAAGEALEPTESTSVFKKAAQPRRAPSIVQRKSASAASVQAPIVTADVTGGLPRGFLMTLQNTDVGVGQATAGSSRRSPEIFIPLVSRDAAPEFWGWPDEFIPDTSNPGKMDRRNVLIRLGGQDLSLNMAYFHHRRDLRLRSEAMRSAGKIDDLLRIEKSDGTSGFEYYVEIIPQGTNDYATYRALCVNKVKGISRKWWGYY